MFGLFIFAVMPGNFSLAHAGDETEDHTAREEAEGKSVWDTDCKPKK